MPEGSGLQNFLFFFSDLITLLWAALHCPGLGCQPSSHICTHWGWVPKNRGGGGNPCAGSCQVVALFPTPSTRILRLELWSSHQGSPDVEKAFFPLPEAVFHLPSLSQGPGLGENSQRDWSSWVSVCQQAEDSWEKWEADCALHLWVHIRQGQDLHLVSWNYPCVSLWIIWRGRFLTCSPNSRSWLHCGVVSLKGVQLNPANF